MQKEIHTPVCSIIMPAYNCEAYIGLAIDSVIRQTYQNWELIIVDDGSADRTKEIIQAYQEQDPRIKLTALRQNQGVANARNAGIKKARGEYIAFLDSDDEWQKDKLDRQIHALESDLQADLVYTAYDMINEDGLLIKTRHVQAELILPDLLKENSIIFSSVVCRRESIENITFQPEWYHEDYVFLLDLLKKGKKFVGINEILVRYRVHKTGRSFNKFRAARYRWRIYRDYLKMNVFDSLYYFWIYAWNGLRKYK